MVLVLADRTEPKLGYGFDCLMGDAYVIPSGQVCGGTLSLTVPSSAAVPVTIRYGTDAFAVRLTGKKKKVLELE